MKKNWILAPNWPISYLLRIYSLLCSLFFIFLFLFRYVSWGSFERIACNVTGNWTFLLIRFYASVNLKLFANIWHRKLSTLSAFAKLYWTLSANKLLLCSEYKWNMYNCTCFALSIAILETKGQWSLKFVGTYVNS